MMLSIYCWNKYFIKKKLEIDLDKIIFEFDETKNLTYFKGMTRKENEN